MSTIKEIKEINEFERMTRMENGERGTFASRIASAWFHADAKNRATLERAFPKLFPDSAFETPLVVAVGDAFDGISLYGPFFDRETAEAFANEDCRLDWHVVELHRPLP